MTVSQTQLRTIFSILSSVDFSLIDSIELLDTIEVSSDVKQFKRLAEGYDESIIDSIVAALL